MVKAWFGFFILFTLAACSSSPTAPRIASTTATPSSVTSTSPPPGSDVVNVTDADNGKTISVRVGQRVRVDLASTYWHYQPPSNPAVLSNQGTPQIQPAPSCMPGGGCGSAIATYGANIAGQATITASRSSCGEAEGCTPASGTFTLRVTVTG